MARGDQRGMEGTVGGSEVRHLLGRRAGDGERKGRRTKIPFKNPKPIPPKSIIFNNGQTVILQIHNYYFSSPSLNQTSPT